MTFTWDIKHTIKGSLIKLDFLDGAYSSDGKWISFADSIPGVLDSERDEESKLFDNLVLNLTPTAHTYICAKWTVDERFFFPKSPSYIAHELNQSQNQIKSIFKSGWGAGWGNSPDFLFVSSPNSNPNLDLILEQARQLKKANLMSENQAFDTIEQISKSYERILYVEDYALRLIKFVPNHSDLETVLQTLQTQISTVAQPHGLIIPNLVEQSI